MTGFSLYPLAAIVEPARGGYYRGWTVAMLPLPRDWARARDILGLLAGRAMNGDILSQYELHQATLSAYRLRSDTVAPLMEWADHV